MTKTDLSEDETMENIGVVCGRFQIFHNEHLEYVLAAKARCARLIVGITSPDPSCSPVEAADPARSAAAANPCSYYERMQMVESVLLEAGVPREEFDIVPFPIGKPELISCYIPQDACIFVTVLDQWGHTKVQRLRDAGYRVEVLWERDKKGVSSTMLRSMIQSGEEWDKFVPDATYRYLAAFNIDMRIRDAEA